MTQYVFRSGARISGPLDAQAIGEWLARLAVQHGREVAPPEVIVDAARDVDSPAHRWFSWDMDPGEAVQRQLEEEARRLVRTIVIVREDDDDGPMRPIPAMVSVVSRADGARGYMPTIVALSDADYRAQVLSDALNAFQALRFRYADLKELSRIFEAVDEATEQQRLPISA